MEWRGMYQEILFCHEQNIERMSANLNPFSRGLVFVTENIEKMPS